MSHPCTSHAVPRLICAAALLAAPFWLVTYKQSVDVRPFAQECTVMTGLVRMSCQGRTCRNSNIRTPPHPPTLRQLRPSGKGMNGQRSTTGTVASMVSASDAGNGHQSSLTVSSSSSYSGSFSSAERSSGNSAVASHLKDDSKAGEVEDLKLQLISAVATLDRGLAASTAQATEVDRLASRLEVAGGSVQLLGDTAASRRLGGLWRLLYTSGFNTGSLGGRRPGPPAALVPSVLGQIYQRIIPSKAQLDNQVEFMSAIPFPPWGSETPALRLKLRHDYELVGGRTVRIVFEETSAEVIGSSMLSSLPRFDIPQLPEFLRPPSSLRAATFDVTFLDATLRITRGDRGELRVFLRDTTTEPELLYTALEVDKN